MKRLTALCLAVVLTAASLSGCAPHFTEKKFEYQFFDTFDTLIQIVGYTDTKEEFEVYADLAHQRFVELHRLFDKFGDYGENGGIAAINRSAGAAPVQADPEVLNLLEYSLGWQVKTGGTVDVTMGPIISIWQEYLARYKNDYENARLPEERELLAAKELCGAEHLQIDREAGTVYLDRKGASLDVGAVAKGYATELVAQELQTAGWESFSINSGGNVRTCGEPRSDTTKAWGVGIQDPFADAVLSSDEQLLDVLFVTDTSVVTSGDYQRFYMVGEHRVHHIIDPATLYPANLYRSVTVVTPDSGLADLFSTALFILDHDTGRALADQYSVGVMWVLADGTVVINDNIRPLLRERGDASNKR